MGSVRLVDAEEVDKDLDILSVGSPCVPQAEEMKAT